ncbi:MAG: hypothetical protein OHK93_004995 [Ramalina farinacea]|uniref:Rhodopsin domain-containing protein n=1 Tax=Ramalina farinacea TaxID=258253 RepID=A0AA43QVS3_9LECA|nr:hypothetical protein [Ramalina farinacea]
MSTSQQPSLLQQLQATTGHANRDTSAYVCTGFCAAIMYSTVLLKMTSKKIAQRRFSADDGWIIFAMSIKVAEVLYSAIMLLTKLSVISLYDQIFPNRNTPNQRLYIYGKQVLRAFAAVQCFAFILVTLLECLPYKKLWDTTVPGHCLDLRISTIVAGSLNVFTDISILMLPIQPISKLRMGRRRKQLVYGNFLIGGILVEISFSILCACVPMYLPLFTYHKRVKQGSGSSRSGESYHELSERPSTKVWSSPARDRPQQNGIHVTRTLENEV